MIWPYKIAILIAMFIAAALSGFFYGCAYERAAALKQAVQAYQNASDIQNEVNLYSDYVLCLALSGRQEQCKIFLSRENEIPKKK